MSEFFRVLKSTQKNDKGAREEKGLQRKCPFEKCVEEQLPNRRPPSRFL